MLTWLTRMVDLQGEPEGGPEDAGRLADTLVGTSSPLEQHVVMLDVEDRSDAEIVAHLAVCLECHLVRAGLEAAAAGAVPLSSGMRDRLRRLALRSLRRKTP